MKNILIIDASYFIFYRYNALLAWFKHSKQEISDEIIKGNDFLLKLEKRIIHVLQELVKKYSAKIVIVCFDGHHNWRKNVLTTYKQNRKHTETLLHSFKFAQKILNKYISENDYYSFFNDNLEADDIVHFIARKFANIEKTSITIIANDSDYIPLLKCNNIKIITLNGKPIRSPIKEDLPYFMLSKILSGDKSDNIPPVFPRCGKKTALKLAKNINELNKKLKSSLEWQQNFERNTILIDNQKIPNKYLKWLETQWALLSKKIFLKELK